MFQMFEKRENETENEVRLIKKYALNIKLKHGGVTAAAALLSKW